MEFGSYLYVLHQAVVGNLGVHDNDGTPLFQSQVELVSRTELLGEFEEKSAFLVIVANRVRFLERGAQKRVQTAKILKRVDLRIFRGQIQVAGE